ncbi:MAG: CPBP family intramembrane metalloprotease [Bacteroidales bacterium]|nr:CPBP family intramembrane metalloprotease [Bacteroidales bacterium]
MSRPRRKTRSFDLASGFSYFIPGLKEIFFLVLWFLLGFLVANIVGVVLMKAFGNDFFLTYGQLVLYPIMFIPAVWYASIKSRRNEGFDFPCVPIDRNGWGGLGAFWAFLLAFIGVAALGFALDPIGAALPEMPDRLKAALDALTNGPLWSSLLMASIFAPLCEEWLCRGMILRGLLNRTKMAPIWAILIQAVAFALMHANIWQGIPALVFGIFFGYVYYRTGSLKLTMFMHFVNNTISVILSRTAVGEYDSYKELFSNAPIYWILVAAALMTSILVVLRFSRVKE